MKLLQKIFNRFSHLNESNLAMDERIETEIRGDVSELCGDISGITWES